MRVLITGANGHLGRQLIARINLEQPQDEVVALVRSARAAEQIRHESLQADIRIVDYRDAAAIGEAGQGCDAAVHLVGIIKESKTNTFSMAHEEACHALVHAGLAVDRLVSLGIVGTEQRSANACFRSRAAAEEILLQAELPATIIRVPMVLGPGDYASHALSRQGRSRLALTFRAGSIEQPIFSGDVVSAILAALSLAPANRVIELGGPESLPRARLIRRAAQQLQGSPLVISLPLALGNLLGWLLESASSNPPVTRAMLGVLDHDDAVDNSAASELLGLQLTPLDKTLAQVLEPG